MEEIAEDKVLHFAGVTLDSVRGCLRGLDAAEVPLAPKPFALLMVLARNAGRTMSKDALLDAVWPNLHVTEDSLFQAVREARRAIGDKAGRVLRSVPRRGYMLDAVLYGTGPPRTNAAPTAPALAPPSDKPSLVVLPFHNMSGDPEQEYFADGIVEDITTALSRIRWLFVIARNSAFTFKGRAVDVRQIGRGLGVRYVLEGSVRRAGGQVRIGCQLIEAETGHNVWADRFDGNLADVFDLQDQIRRSVVGAIEPTLQRAEIARANIKPTDSLDAYDLYLRAVHQCYQMTRGALDSALSMLHRALEIDPNFSLAKGYLCWVYITRDTGNWLQPGDREAAVAIARELIASRSDDPVALRGAGHAMSQFARDYKAAFATLNRALDLHPNSAQILHSLGYVHCHACDPAPAAGYFERALHISPRDLEIGYIQSGLGLALLMTGRNEAAYEVLVQAVEQMPRYGVAHRCLIQVCTRLGRRAEARVVAARLLQLIPDYRVSNVPRPFADTAFMEEYVMALRSAGVPE
ncbi:winged helix-turn-helix domain-containing protein [Falsiroseomonas sp. E2-1-a20]|uniref:winged helix-turn-helix domain-containing protein n=1 Tax=Falsiroseomonas sp. E2-1-a20 TaxID=3239300 RepID=UPI003F3D3FF0